MLTIDINSLEKYLCQNIPDYHINTIHASKKICTIRETKKENKCGYVDNEQVAKTLTIRVIYRIYTRY